MAILDRFTKQPNDIKKYQIDYSEWLDTGITVSGVITSVEILNPAAGDVGEPTISVGTPSIIDSGLKFQYYMSSGTNGKKYKVTFQASTSDAQLVESEIEFKVKDT